MAIPVPPSDGSVRECAQAIESFLQRCVLQLSQVPRKLEGLAASSVPGREAGRSALLNDKARCICSNTSRDMCLELHLFDGIEYIC